MAAAAAAGRILSSTSAAPSDKTSLSGTLRLHGRRGGLFFFFNVATSCLTRVTLGDATRLVLLTADGGKLRVAGLKAVSST